MYNLWYKLWYKQFHGITNGINMKLVKALTVKEVNAIKKVGFTSLGGVTGLYLQVVPSGRRYYVYRFKAKDGKRSFVSIAPFGSIDLAEARERAKQWKQKVNDGINPSEAKKAEALAIRLKAQARQEEQERLHRSVNFISELWFEERARSGFWAKNDVGELHTMRFLNNYIRPIIGKVPIAELSPHDVFNTIIPTYQKMPNTAEKCLTIISSFWKWSKAKGWTSGENPADRHGTLGVLLEPYKNDRAKAKNHPALSPEDIPDFFIALKRFNTVAARLTEFMILTACRSKMARYLKWSDIDFDSRTATVDESSLKTKGRGKHTIFLSDQALELLQSLHRQSEEYVFVSERGKPFSDAAPCVVIRQLNKLEFANDRTGWIDREQTKETGSLVPITVHGTSRATFKTWSKTGENRKLLDEEAVELCLAHNLKDDYNGAYNRTHLEDERRVVMQVWGSYCYSKIC